MGDCLRGGGAAYRGAMRHLALALVLLGCSADPVIAPRDCTPGTTTTCACPGASGVQTCTAAGTVGACVCPDGGGGADAVAVGDGGGADAPSTGDGGAPVDVVAVGDVPSDAHDAAPTDDGRDPRCPSNAPAMCAEGSCWNLQTSNGMVPARHCGACNAPCPSTAPECVSGRCTALAPDAGR